MCCVRVLQLRGYGEESFRYRCSLVLVSELIPLEYIIDRGNRFVEEFRRAFSRQVVAYGANASEALWARPLVGWIKVNVDVAVSTSVNKAAELWAIHDGLLHAWTSGYQRIVVELDCLEAMRIVNSVSVAMHESPLVLLIKRWLLQDWQVGVCHVGRVCNRVTDKMAARGRASLITTTFFPVPLDEIRV
ncbi:hypothetical protein V6N11_060511 [Hibiscus sabdariffa]|uniref:RNase H type-1 domain-containing protein n=1 Tax=Hibiscus sabdariffa TaxID=183260 RepID=A0ABR2QQK0_9ROSI